MPLDEYQRKRKFSQTPEPHGKPAGIVPVKARFVVQKHRARRLHYDLRLEMEGVLKSWAVPKGPSLNPRDKRLAVMTEDHPLEYGGFEGVIPEGNYGAGTVIIWDNGDYVAEGPLPPEEQVARGEIKFTLQGKKLRGSFVLVKIKGRPMEGSKGNEGLLIKHDDAYADASWDIEEHPESATTGRNLDEVKQGLPPGQVKTSLAAAALEGAEEAPMPEHIEPMLATLLDKPFSSPDWIFELKWDGMRVLAFLDEGRCRLQARSGRDVTGQFPEMADLPGRVAARQAILDGEIVVLDAQGRGDFGQLQPRMHTVEPSPGLLKDAPVHYYAFDILYCDGYDLRLVALEQRKQLLKEILRTSPPALYSDHVLENGNELYELAGKHGAEGIIGKQIHSPYVAGRSASWVKLKTVLEADAVIGGFTAPAGGRQHLGALLVGLYEGRDLIFAGGVGTGFTGKLLESLAAELEPLKTKNCPFSEIPDTKEKAYWVKPELVARVKYGSWTHDGRLRAAVFLGLRKDLAPKECRLSGERPVSLNATSTGSKNAAPQTVKVAASLPLLRDRAEIENELRQGKRESVVLEIDGKPIRLTNLNKIYFPEPGYTKRDLLAYYYGVSEFILPFLKDRPLVLHRYPNGVAGGAFYQKEAADETPEWVDTFPIHSEERGKAIRYLVVNDLAALLYVANLGCIEQHPWSSRTGDLECPDYVFFDLDPTEGASYDTVVEVARSVHKVLEQIRVRVFFKTSGATGFHMYLPLERNYDYEHVRSFAEIVARLVAGEMQKQVTLERSVGRRDHGKVYIDYSQNAYGRPLATVYSVRPFALATVSAPVSLKELKRGLTPERFTIKTMPARLEKTGDLWADFWEQRQTIETALERLSTKIRKKG